MTVQILDQLSALELQNFDLETLIIDSKALKKNLFKDPTLRRNPILIPKNTKGPLPVVLCLSGLMGNGSDYFNPRYGEENTIQKLDRALGSNKAPQALYVFVDAMTSWGGSQYINSPQGNYEDYIVKELVPALHETYDVSSLAKHWCVTGGSSGGYGSLHLASKFPNIFGVIAAFAPDCFFEASLLPEFYKTLHDWTEHGGPRGLFKLLKSGDLRKNKNFPSIVNAVGMSLCYADGELPIDGYTGCLKPQVWNQFHKHDPLVFFPQRLRNLKKLHAILIDVGIRDQFDLHLGCRQLHQWLRSKKIRHRYTEFNGTHFDGGSRRPETWMWLKKMWG
jgi:enterochelin esterase family protein